MRHFGGASVVADAVLAVIVTTPGPTASPLRGSDRKSDRAQRPAAPRFETIRRLDAQGVKLSG